MLGLNSSMSSEPMNALSTSCVAFGEKSSFSSTLWVDEVAAGDRHSSSSMMMGLQSTVLKLNVLSLEPKGALGH